MFDIEKPIITAEDISEYVGLSTLSILRHCRGERFSPTLGKNFPMPFASGCGNKLKWFSADFVLWVNQASAARQAEMEIRVVNNPAQEAVKRGRGRPKNSEKPRGELYAYR